MMLSFLDLFFLCFHSGLILFNVLGWAHPRTRPWNLLTLTLTALSWVVIGYFYGWGYCICTDWHWQVLQEKGQYGLPNSYLTYLSERLLGISPDRKMVDTIALAGLIVPLGLNLFLKFRKEKKRTYSN